MGETDPSEPHRQPLDYARADPSQFSRRAVAVGGGVVVGIIGVIGAGFLSFVLFENRAFEAPRPPPPKAFYVVAFIFFALAGVGVLTFILNLMSSPRRRWFLMGLSIGAAATALVEGLCFSNG